MADVIIDSTGGGEHRAAVELTAAEHRPGISGQIVAGREEPCMTGHPSELPGPRVMHLAPQPLPVALLGGGRPGSPGSIGREAGVGHAQRREDPLGSDVGQRAVAEGFHQPAEHDEVRRRNR